MYSNNQELQIWCNYIILYIYITTSTILLSESPNASLSLSLSIITLAVPTDASPCVFICLRCLQFSALVLMPGLCMAFAAVQDSDVVLELTVLPVEVRQKIQEHTRHTKSTNIRSIDGWNMVKMVKCFIHSDSKNAVPVWGEVESCAKSSGGMALRDWNYRNKLIPGGPNVWW